MCLFCQVTRTLARASTDLWHFLVLFLGVVLGYGILG